MLKHFIVTIVTALCLTAGAYANEAAEKTIFAEAVKRDPDGLATALKVTKAMEDGKELPVVEDGQIIMSRLAISLHGWAVTRGYLNDEAAKDYKVFQAAFVERHGEKFPVDQVKGMKLVVPAKVARLKDAAPTVVTAPVQPAVAAASAPNAPAPVAVAEAPAPAVKSALPSDVVTEDKLSAAIKQHQEATVASTDSLARTLFGVAKREAKTVAELKKSVKAISGGNKALEEKMLALAAEETAARKAQLQAVNDHLGRTDGTVTGVNDRVSQVVKYGYILAGALALLAIAGFILWRRITTVREEVVEEAVAAAEAGSEATLKAAQAAIRAGEARAAETVRTVKADVAYAVEEAEHATARVAGLAKRVGDIEAAVDLKHFSFEDDDILALVHGLPIGGTTSFDFTVDGQPFTLQFERVDATMVKVIGIKDQRNAVKIDNLPARIKRAANKGVLIGITPVTDVIALPMRKSA